MVGSRLTTHTYVTLVGPCRVVCLPVVHNWPHTSPSVIPKRRTYIVDSPSTRLCPTNTFFSALFNRLRVHLRVVILLAGRDLNRQLVLPGRQRTGRIRGQRARRVVGAVEIQNQSAVAHGAGVQKAARRIGVGLPSRVAKDDEQPPS